MRLFVKVKWEMRAIVLARLSNFVNRCPKQPAQQFERRIGEQVTQETRYYLLSFACKVETFARAVEAIRALKIACTGCSILPFVKMSLVFELDMLTTIWQSYVILHSISSGRSKRA